VLTSETDWATKYAFPAGRWFSTFFENEQEISRWNAVLKQDQKVDEQQANRAAISHFELYRTHRLYPEGASQVGRMLTADEGAQAALHMNTAWANDKPGRETQIYSFNLPQQV